MLVLLRLQSREDIQRCTPWQDCALSVMSSWCIVCLPRSPYTGEGAIVGGRVFFK